MPDGFGGGTRQRTRATSKARRRPSLGLMALEPRVMYDGVHPTLYGYQLYTGWVWPTVMAMLE